MSIGSMFIGSIFIEEKIYLALVMDWIFVSLQNT